MFSMREFTPPSFPIYMYDKDGEYKVATIGEVCFLSYDPEGVVIVDC